MPTTSESEKRSFSPDDQDKWLEEKTEAEYGPKNYAERFGQPKEYQLQRSVERAKYTAMDPEYRWGGKSPLDAAEAFKEPQKSVGSERPWDQEQQRIYDREYFEIARRVLIGFWGERLLGEPSIRDAKTVYAGQSARPENYGYLSTRDVAEYTGMNRKDLIIRSYFLSQVEASATMTSELIHEFEETNKDKLKISERDALETISIHIHLLRNYERIRNAWNEANPSYNRPRPDLNIPENRPNRQPNIAQLYKFIINQEAERQQNAKEGPWGNADDPPNGNAIHAWSEFLLQQESRLVFHDSDFSDNNEAVKLAAQMQQSGEAYLTQKDIVDELATANPEDPALIKANNVLKGKKLELKSKYAKAEKYGESLYWDIATPDAILVDGNEVPRGIMEVKAYTKEEVVRWIELLRYNLENSQMPIYEGRVYWQHGLAITAYQDKELAINDPKNPKNRLMNYGFNPDAYSRFLNVVGGVTPDKVDNIQENGDPFVLRLTDDIPYELIQELGDAIQESGYTNFIIQQVGIKERDIVETAQRSLARDKGPIKDVVEDPLLKRMVDSLNRPESWRF